MKRLNKKMISLILCMLMAAAVCVSALPAVAGSAYAKETEDTAEENNQGEEAVLVEEPETSEQTSAETEATQETEPETSAEPESTKAAAPETTESASEETTEETGAVTPQDEAEEFLKEDGNYYVEIALWDEAEDKALDWNLIFKNNSRALVTVKNETVTDVRIATNPAVVDKKESALTHLKVNGKTVTVDKKLPFSTQPADKDYEYIQLGSFVGLPRNAQPEAADEPTFVSAEYFLPDLTDKKDDSKDKETADDKDKEPEYSKARIRFDWSTLKATDDKELKAVNTTASDSEDPMISTDPCLIKLEKGKSAELKAQVVNGVHYTFSYKSAKESIATVKEADKKVTVTAVSSGETVITVTAKKEGQKDLTRTVKVKIKDEEETTTEPEETTTEAEETTTDPEETTTEQEESTTGEDPTTGSSQEFKDDATGVVVKDVNGIVPSGTVLVVKEITEGDAYDKVKAKSYVSGCQFKLYDIRLKDASGNNIDLNGQQVEVYLPIPDGWKEDRLWIARFADDGSAYAVKDGSASNGMFKFASSNLTMFALIEKQSADTPTTSGDPQDQVSGDEYKDKATGIIVKDPASYLPDGSKLVVKQITEGTDYTRVKSLSYVGSNPFVLYDIHFEDASGNDVQPTGRVTVSIPLPSGWPTTGLSVVHINKNNTASLITGMVTNSMYQFGTSSFSSFALVQKSTNATTTTRRNTVTTRTTNTKSVRTGDETPIAVWVIIAAAACATIILLLAVRRRKESN